VGSAELRSLIEAPDILVMPGAFDGFSARLIERAGYQAAFISGAGVSESRLGLPDVGIAGLAEAVSAARDIAACIGLPVIADADTGYGNAVNVHFTIRAFEGAGVAGVMIEDQVWPKRCGHLAGKEVIGAEEMAGKVAAAVGARTSPDLVIMARTDAAGPLGIAEAVERGRLYAAAGADLLFADALLSEADIERFAAEVSAPVAVNMGFGIRRRRTTPLLSPRQLEQLGVSVVIVPRLLTAAAARGMELALAALGESIRTGEVVEREELLLSFEELHELMGFDQLVELERSFLTAEQFAVKYGSPEEGAG
jgi:2-methylisocitrate lyase-like PEP mutase family enzyme